MKLPEKAILCGIGYRIQAHEGLIVFTEESGIGGSHTRIAFELRSHHWYVSFSDTWGKIMVKHLVAAYKIVEETVND